MSINKPLYQTPPDSRFRFGRPEEDVGQRSIQKQPKSDSERIKWSSILIVEDELLVAENLKDALQKEGYKVTEVVSSAEEAVRRFSNLNPNLILMDIRLAGSMDGVQAAILIHETLKRVPILFLTAYPEDEFPHLIAIDRDLYAFLTKPYDLKQLTRTIEKLLTTRS